MLKLMYSVVQKQQVMPETSWNGLMEILTFVEG